jgi:paraquat-inducible protein A
LHHRKTNSLARSWALLLAAMVFYIPANTLPVLTAIQLGRGEPATILGGVSELAAGGQWPLAALVFVASIVVPVLKLLSLAWLLISVRLRRGTGLVDRTRLYRIVEAVGRWSMIDVFMISILTALVQAGTLATIIPGPGVLSFCAVVILTMLAANSFDPRLMWDAANPESDTKAS